MRNLKSDGFIVVVSMVVLGVLARLIPHPPNFSPMNSISLFSGVNLSRRLSLALTLGALLISDLLLSALKGYPAFGSWSFFTYSGFAAIILLGSYWKPQGLFSTAGAVLGSSLFFWIWTNFGIWATQSYGMYPLTFSGLVACYTAALPFLANSLMGDALWASALFLSFQGMQSLAPRLGWKLQKA